MAKSDDSSYINSAGEKVYTDADGKEYVLDEMGNRRPPQQISTGERASGFWVYDTSQGHCAFCGRLTCQGYCMGGG